VTTQVAVGLVVLGGLGAAYALLSETGLLATIMDGEALREWIGRLGIWGPLSVIGLMTLAIVMSPIPSAPIALAAGAAFGHGWGTLYVLIGAETGALVAFAIARLVGHGVLKRWFGERLSVGLLGSQNTIMAIVFATRLMPFVSFDLISYAAGLTSLRAWRFAVATLLGIVPASFLLTHFGGEMASADGQQIAVAALSLGALTAVSAAVRIVWVRYRKRTPHRQEP
jgi:uncharacterized membrane protein YdjX (TVP38/TMEM64 family)